MVRPTQDIGRWDPPVRILIGVALIGVSLIKFVGAPSQYPASDPRADPLNWALFGIFLSGIGVMFIVTAMYPPLRAASMGLDSALPPGLAWIALALFGIASSAALVVIGVAFELPILVIFGVASAAVSVGRLGLAMRRRQGG